MSSRTGYLPDPAGDERLLTAREVAARTGLSYHAILRAIRRGELRAVRLCGRVRIWPGDLTVWINRSTISNEKQEHRPKNQPVAPTKPPAAGSLAALHRIERKALPK